MLVLTAFQYLKYHIAVTTDDKTSAEEHNRL
jgi:hypothetical protein